MTNLAVMPVPIKAFATYATLENIIYVSGGIILMRVAAWLYWPIRKLFSPLRHLQRPPNGSFLFGNLKQVFAAPSAVVHEGWIQEYGSTYAYRGFLSVSDPAYRNN